MMTKHSPALGENDGHTLAVALEPHRDAILGRLAQTWRMRAPKGTVMLGTPQRLVEAAESIGTVWFTWLANVADLSVVRELAISLVRQGMTYTTATALGHALATTVTELMAGDDQYEVTALKLTRHFSTVFLDQIATQHELRTQQEQEHLAVQLQASAEVGRAAASILDTDQLLREVVNLITDRFGFYYTAVFTLDHTGQYALLREATGQAGEVLKNLNHKLDIHGKSMVGAAITSRKPRVAVDVSSEALRFSNPLLPDTQSEIALPLTVGDQVLGALDVQSTEPRAFDSTAVTVLQNMADQIAIALENAQLFERNRQAVEQSQATQQLLSALIDSIPSPVFFKDMRGAYLGCNRAYEAYLGWTRDALIGKSVFDIAPHDLAVKYQAKDQELYDQPGVQIYEAAVEYADGTRHNVIFNKATFTDAHGQLAGLVGVMQDITERKQTEEALQRNQEQLSQALRIAQLGYWEYDVARDVFLFNDQFYALFRTAADAEGGYEMPSARYAQKFVHPDDAPLVGAEIGLALQSTDPNYSRQIDHRIFYADGQPGYITVRFRVERDAAGRPIKFIGANEDITERKLAEAALQRERGLLRGVIDSVPDLIFYKDQQGVYLGCNLAFEAFAGRSERELIGRTDHDLFSSDIADFFREQDAQMLTTRTLRRNEEWVTYPDSRRVLLDTLKTPFYDEAGQVLGLIGISRDITARKQADSERERLLARTETLYHTSADLNAAHTYSEVLDVLRAHTVMGEADRNISLNLYDKPWVNEEMPEWCIPIERWTTLPMEAVADRYRLRDFSAAQLLRADAPTIVSDVGTDERLDEATRQLYTVRFQAGSTVFVPLVAAGQWIGFLNAVYSEPRAFGEEDIRLLMAATVQAGVVIQSIRRLTEVAESEARFRDVALASVDIVWETDARGRYVFCSERVEEVLGYTVAEILGKTPYDIVAPDEVERVREILTQAAQARLPIVDVEVRSRTSDGRTLFMRINGVPMLDASGEYLGYRGVLEDITARRQIELDLAQERNLLRTLIDTLPERIFAKDTESRFTLANAAEIELDGATSFEELRGKNDFDFYPPELAQQYYDAERPIIEEGRAMIGYEERSVDQEGNPRWHISTKVPLRDAAGHIIGLVGMTRDVTQMKEVEVALAEESNRLRTLIDSLPDSIFIKDRASRFVVNNLAHLRVLGATSQAEVAGKTDFDFFPREIAQQYFSDEQEVMRLGQPLLNREETVINAATGQAQSANTTKIPLRNVQGEVVGFVGFSQDITERKQAEVELQQRERLLRTIIDATPDWIFIKDQTHRYQLVNQGYANDLHISPDHFIGKDDLELGFPEELVKGNPEKGIAGFWADDRAVMDSGQRKVIPNDIVTIDGALRVLHTIKTPLRDAAGNVWGVLAFGRDVTEREQLLADQQQRALHLQTAAEVGRVATSLLNPDQLLGKIVGLIAERFGFYHVAAYTVDESSRWALLRDATGEVGQQLKDRGQALAIRGQSLVGAAIRLRQPRIALDVGPDAVQFNDPLLPDTHSEIALPLFIGDQVLGALDIHSTAPAAFDDRFAVLLQSMADQIAVALNTAEQYQREQAHVEQTNRLMQIVIDLSERTDRAGLQNRLVRSAPTLLNTDRAQFWLKDASGLELKAAHSVRPGADQNLAISQELADRVCRTGVPLRLDGPPAQAGYASRITDVPFNSALLTPISWQGQTTGVLSVMRSQPGRPFTQDDENAAQLLAAQVAAALENITLSEQQQHRAMQLQTAAEVSRASSTILQLEELLNTVVELVRDNFNLYYVGAFLLDEQAEWAYLRAGTGEAGRKMLQAGHRLRVDESSMIGWAIVHRQARIALDVGAEAAHFDNPLLPNTRSEMALPLISRGRIIGATTIQSTQPAAFTPEDITTLQTMADQITTAAENARLFEQTQQTVRHMTALNEITQAISREIELRPTLEATYHSLQNLMSVDAFMIALYDPATNTLEFPLVYDEGRNYQEPSAVLAPESRIARVIQTGQPILELISREDWRQLTSIANSIGNPGKPSASLLYVPLKRGNEIIGILSVQSYQFNAYTREHLDLLGSVANQLAITILNVRLYEQTRRAVDDLDALNRRLTGEAWQSYVQVRAPGSVIWHTSDPSLTQIGETQAEQLAAGEIAVQQVADEAEISVPIALRGQLIGALRFRAPTDKWTAEAQAIATSIASHLAQAAENTRLLEQTQRTAQREQQIAQAADKIHRASNLESILQTAVQEIARITGSTEVGIQLGRVDDMQPSTGGNGHPSAEQLLNSNP